MGIILSFIILMLIISFLLFYLHLDEPLFLIPKSHPESQHPLLEWRLSFSLVERKILFNIPTYQRTAYIIIKETLDGPINFNDINGYKSYHLKTILLELTTQPCEGIKNAYLFVKALLERLCNAYRMKKLPNFFIPSQNLLKNENGSFIDEFWEALMDNDRYQKFPYDPSLMFERTSSDNIFPDLVPINATILTKLLFSDFPLLENDENHLIPSGSINLLFLIEVYIYFLHTVKYFLSPIFLQGYCDTDKLVEIFIAIRRLFRLLQLQDSIEINNCFDELFKPGSAEEYLEKCLYELRQHQMRIRPQLVETDGQFKQLISKLSNEDLSNNSDVTRAEIVENINQLKESQEGKKLYQILMNLNSLVTKAISKGGNLSHLFCQTALTMNPSEEDLHFQLLDELIKKIL